MTEFKRLQTNPRPDLASFGDAERRTVIYLEQVLEGDGKRPHCPFVPMVHQGNGYRWKEYAGEPKSLCLARVAGELASEFWRLSPRLTSSDQPVDITTAVAAFSHPDCNTAEFGKRLEAARNTLRQLVLEQGLMLAHMFSGHDDPKGGGRYVSPIPLLMVRRMHEPDRVFMKTPPELAAYRRFFLVDES